MKKPKMASLFAYNKDRAFEIASLGADVDGGDFYYQFRYPRAFEDWAINLPTERVGFRPDHVSFHRDGTIHITPKGKNKTRIELGRADEPLLGCPATTFTPLLIDSVYAQPNGWDLRSLSRESSLGQGWDFTEIANFSVLLFLIHNSRSPSAIFNSHGFSAFWKTFTPMFRFEAFRDWSVIAFLSDYVFPRLDPIVISQNAPETRFRGTVHHIGRIFQPIDLHIHYRRLINPEAHRFLLV